MIELHCPICHDPLAPSSTVDFVQCRAGHTYRASEGVVDLVGNAISDPATAAHYTKQWSAELGIADFMRASTAATEVAPGRQLGWTDLVGRIRDRARRHATRVYDAGCGFGWIFADLFASPVPEHLTYVGADVHHALGDIPRPPGLAARRAQFLRWDISQPLPSTDRFDYVICRAAIHHTAEPERTLESLASSLLTGGILAISAYARKAPMREAIDDLFREHIRTLPPDAALATCRQFTALGAALQACEATIEITQDLPLLRIERGTYRVQEFIYDHFIKCWFNQAYGHQYSDVVNYDWYHPTYAHRFELDELVHWFLRHGLTVTRTASITAQHYVEGEAS